MSPVFDRVWMTMTFFCLLGPLIFGGLMVVLDPSGLRGVFAGLAEGVQRFVSNFRSPWVGPWLPPTSTVGPDPKADFALRLVGVAIVVAGVLGLMETLP